MTDSGCKEKDSITLSALHLSCLQSQHRIDKAVSAATSLGWILAPVDYSSCSFSVLVLGKHFLRHFLSPSILSWDSVCLKRIFMFIHWALDGRELLPAEDLPYCPGTEEVSLWTVRASFQLTLWLQLGTAWALVLINKFLHLFLPHMLLFSLETRKGCQAIAPYHLESCPALEFPLLSPLVYDSPVQPQVLRTWLGCSQTLCQNILWMT